MGVHHVAGDQAVEVDHGQHIGALAGAQRIDKGLGATQAFLFGAEADDLQAVFQLQAAEVLRHFGQHAGA